MRVQFHRSRTQTHAFITWQAEVKFVQYMIYYVLAPRTNSLLRRETYTRSNPPNRTQHVKLASSRDIKPVDRS